MIEFSYDDLIRIQAALKSCSQSCEEAAKKRDATRLLAEAASLMSIESRIIALAQMGNEQTSYSMAPNQGEFDKDRTSFKTVGNA